MRQCRAWVSCVHVMHCALFIPCELQYYTSAKHYIIRDCKLPLFHSHTQVIISHWLAEANRSISKRYRELKLFGYIRVWLQKLKGHLLSQYMISNNFCSYVSIYLSTVCVWIKELAIFPSYVYIFYLGCVCEEKWCWWWCSCSLWDQNLCCQ